MLYFRRSSPHNSHAMNPSSADTRRPLVAWLAAAFSVGVVFPVRVYLELGSVGPLGWGLTVFLVVLCWLIGIGETFANRPEYHTAVKPTGGLGDRIGGFWLLACAFGPLAGWFVTNELVAYTETNWRWRFALRVLLGGVLPVVTALPLVRYVRGRAALVAAPILVLVTALSASSVLSAGRDLLDGPVTRRGEIVVLPDGAITFRALDGPPVDVDFGGRIVRPARGEVTITLLAHSHRLVAMSPELRRE